MDKEKLKAMGLGDDAVEIVLYLENGNFRDGNYSVSAKVYQDLNFDIDRYRAARIPLIERGFVTLSRGRGGRICIDSEAFLNISSEGGKAKKPAADTKEPEASYYDRIKKIAESLCKDVYVGDYIVEVTARQGERDVGKWRRPDITAGGVEAFKFAQPKRVLNIVSFEVKLFDRCSVDAVYEALAHGRFSTVSYLVIVFNSNDEREFYSVFDNNDRMINVYDECRKRGVGLCGVSKDEIESPVFWYMLDPRENAPDPYTVDDFVTRQLTEEARKFIADRLP